MVEKKVEEKVADTVEDMVDIDNYFKKFLEIKLDRILFLRSTLFPEIS